MSRRSAAFVVLAGALYAGLAQAGVNVDISFGAQIPIQDDNRIFVSVNSRYYDREPAFVDQWSTRFRNPDDLQVFLFLSRHSSASPQVIWDLRKGGMSWFRISQRVRVPMDAYFVRLDGPAYPPFDGMYGRYDQYLRNPKKYKPNFTDGELRSLVVVRTMSDYYRLPPGQAMKLRASGKDCRSLMAQEYRKRHENEYRAANKSGGKDSPRDHDQGRGNDSKPSHDNGNKQGHDNGKGHGNDKNHDKDRDR
jgi:hypothetical protein